MQNPHELDPDCEYCGDSHTLCITCEEPAPSCDCTEKHFSPCHNCQEPDCQTCLLVFSTCEDCSEPPHVCECGGQQRPCHDCVVDDLGRQVSS